MNINSPVSLRGSAIMTTPPPLPSQSRTGTVSPRKDEYLPEDDGYASDENDTNVDGFVIIGEMLVPPREEVPRNSYCPDILP